MTDIWLQVCYVERIRTISNPSFQATSIESNRCVQFPVRVPASSYQFAALHGTQLLLSMIRKVVMDTTFITTGFRYRTSGVMECFINNTPLADTIESASRVDSASHQRLWSRGYDSRLGLSKDIKCERSQVRVLATSCSFAFWRLWWSFCTFW